MGIHDLPLPYVLDRTKRGPVTLTGVLEDRLLLSGTSNYGSPAQEYADKIAGLLAENFVCEAAEAIWMSAWAANNPTSDYHYQASACYYEAQRRGNPDLYQQAYDQARGIAG
jgi:hypothetical protein